MKSRILASVAIITIIACNVSLTFSAHADVGTDAFNLSAASIVGGSPTDVANWPITTSLTVDLSGNVITNFDKRDGSNRWPDQPFGDGSLEYTVWLFLNINGQWVGSGFIQMWNGRPDTGDPITDAPCNWYYGTAWEPMDPNVQFKAGDELGFMVTAGNERLGTSTSVQERSNIVLVPAPTDSTPADQCQNGGSSDNGSDNGSTDIGSETSGGTIQNPGAVLPPPGGTSSSSATATSGAFGALAFSSDSNKWLVVSTSVVSGQPGTIQGRMMDENNNPIGAAFPITGGTGSDLTPKVAYSPDTKQFLVVWNENTSGNNDIVYGQFLDQNGTLVGSSFQIYSGSSLTFASNALLQYDSVNKKFVTTWEAASSEVQVITVGNDGTPGAVITFPLTGTIKNRAPSIAVDPKSNQYCVSYQWYDSTGAPNPSGIANASAIAVRPVDAATGTVGSESFVTYNAFYNYGIAYDSLDDHYLVTWETADLQSMDGQIISTCAGDPTAAPIQIGGTDTAATVSYNATSNTFGIVSQDHDTANNLLYVLDGSGGSIILTQSIFGDGTGNFSPVIAPNTTTGTFSAVTSQNYSTTQFASNLGGPQLISRATTVAQNGPFSAPTTSTPQTQGLPTDLGALISSIFIWSLNIVGLAIFFQFFRAGYKWFTAAGNPGRIADAKNIMFNALIGVLILFAAYVILYTINPDLVKSSLNLPGLPGPSGSPSPSANPSPSSSVAPSTSATPTPAPNTGSDDGGDLGPQP